MGQNSSSNLPVTQIVVAVSVAVAVYLLVDLGRMVWANVLLRQMVAEQESRRIQLQRDVEQVELMVAEVEEGSGQHFEELVREELHLVQEGDVPIIVDPPVWERAGGILPVLAGTEPQPARPHWHEWRDLFISW